MSDQRPNEMGNNKYYVFHLVKLGNRLDWLGETPGLSANQQPKGRSQNPLVKRVTEVALISLRS